MRREDIYVGPLARIAKIETRPDERHHTIFTRYIEPVKNSDTVIQKMNDDYYVDLSNNAGYRSALYAHEDDVCVYEEYLVKVAEYFDDIVLADDLTRTETKQLAKSIRKK